MKSILALLIVSNVGPVLAKQPSPPVATDDGTGVIELSGEMHVESTSSWPCKIEDYSKAWIDDKTHDLAIFVVPEVAGVCTDASVVLPKGWIYKELTATIINNDKHLSCEIYKPILSAQCGIEYWDSTGHLGWSSAKPSECIHYVCGATPIQVDTNLPKNACVDIGENARTVYTYLRAYPADQNASYRIKITMERCPSGGDFESN